MAFKVKDLMIDVAGIAGPNLPCITGTAKCCALNTRKPPCYCTVLNTRPCLPCSNHAPSWYACDGGTYGCGATWDTTTPVYQTTETIFQQTPQLTPGDITPLKEHLRMALELLDKQEQVLQEQLAPKTLDDVTLLEGKLTEALDSIKAQKAELQKKSK